MKKLSALLIVFAFLFPAAIVQADKDQAVFAIQKAKIFIEKVKAKSEDMKTPDDALRSAKDCLEKAEALLKKNTSILGKLRKEVEPDIFYYAEMAEIHASITLSRLEKASQEKENARLEKLIPDVEAKIKIITDKNAEIQRLTEEVKKPKGSMQSLNSEITLLKKEKNELSEQAAKLKLERENMNGKLEALGSVLASTKKDLTDRIKTGEELTAENQRLKDDLKSLETQKGSDIVAIRSKMQTMERDIQFYKALAKISFLLRMSAEGGTFIIPRKELIKTQPKGSILAPGAETHMARFSDLVKTFPECRLKIGVHGFGNPAKAEDKKATDLMAHLLKDAFIKSGIKESSLEIIGAGAGSPLFSKSAVEENRRVEITVSR